MATTSQMTTQAETDNNLPAGVTQAKAPQVDSGLIAANQTAPQVTGSNTAANVAQVNPSQFDPNTTNVKGTGTATDASLTNWKVDQPQTVAGQVTGLIAANSPLLQQARANAADASNARGLYNSSIGVQAGEAAAYGAALPIAQQDASTYADSAKTNAAAANQNSQFNAGQKTQVSEFNAGQTNALQGQLLQESGTVAMANADAQNKANQFDAQTGLQSQIENADNAVKQSAQQYDASVKVAMQNSDQASKLQLQQIDAETRQALAQIQAKYNVQMQTSSSMSNMYQNLIDSVTKVMQDQNLDANAKQVSIGNLTRMYNDQMQLQSSISGLNLGSLLDPTQFGGSGTASPQPGTSTPGASSGLINGNGGPGGYDDGNGTGSAGGS